MTTRIAVIGSGNVGGNLGVTLSQAGFPVRWGVRNDEGVDALRARAGKDASSGTPAAVAEWAEVVFLAVPATAAIGIATSLAKELDGKIVVDCTNPLVWNAGPVWDPPEEGSLAAAIAKAVPGARVIKSFNTFGAEFHGDPARAGAPSAQVFLAGDDADAKKALEVIATRAGFRPVDAGPLRNAALVENLAILWIHLATVGGHGRDFVFAMQDKR